MMNLCPSWVLMKYAECFHHIISTKCMSAVSMFTRAVAKGWPCFFQWKRGRNNLRFFTQVASDRSSLAHRTRFGGRLASSWPCLYPWWCKTLANLIGFDRCIISVSHPLQDFDTFFDKSCSRCWAGSKSLLGASGISPNPSGLDNIHLGIQPLM